MKEIGTVFYNKELNKYFVEDIEVLDLGTALINDLVAILPDGKITEIIKSDDKTEIYGILKLTSRVKQGSNKRGVPIYLFRPYHHKYPNFLVCSNKKPRKNIFCSISFNKWDNIRKVHFGKMERIIGETGNYDNEIQYIIACNNLNHPGNNKMIKKFELNEKIKCDKEMIEGIQDRIPDLEVISIDPNGCTDIDDAFSFTENEDSCEYIINIAIADLMKFLDEKMYNLIKSRFFTIYYDGGKNNMIPNVYAEDLISLREGFNRYSIVTKFVYNASGECINFSFNRFIIKNIKAYSYEEVDKIFSKGRYKNSMDKMLLRLKSFMNKKLGIKDVNSHNLIEYFMIKANKSVGKYLVDSGLKTVLRSHMKVENIEKYIDGIEDEKLMDFLRIRNMKKAVYNFSSNNESDNYHFGLNLNYYTHFTSPIRRFPDILVHEALCKVCDIDNKFNICDYDKSLLDEINKKEKSINKCERKLNKLRVIKDLEKEGYFERDYDGYVTGFNDIFIEVFIPSLKLEDKVRVVPRKFEELYEVDIVEDGLEMIVRKCGEELMRFKIYEKVILNITTFLNEEVFNNKIKISLKNII